MQPDIKIKLDRYHELLCQWQKTINLVSPNTLKDAWQRHFEDSIQLSDFIDNSVHSVVDIGSGAGFPALVLAIMNPDKEFILVESDSRKCGFLRHVSRETNLNNVTIYNSRIEDVLADLKPDLISARALASLDKLLMYTKPCWISNHELTLLLPKGQTYQDEISDADACYNFEYDIAPSKIDSQSYILTVRNIREID